MSRYEIPDDMPLDAMSQYMHDVRWTPDLSEEEERELVVCVERGKIERSHPFPDAGIVAEMERAKERLLEGFQGLVIHLAKKWRRCCPQMEMLDLIQEGNIGLLQAIEHHGLSPFPLRALASHCITCTMIDALRGSYRMVRLPSEKGTQVAQMRQAARTFELTHGRDPSYQELAGVLNISLREVCERVEWGRCDYVESVQAVIADNSHEDHYPFTSVFDSPGDGEEETGRVVAIRQALQAVLSKKQYVVLSLRYGKDGQCVSHAEMSQMLQVTKEATFSAEWRALAKLQEVYCSPADVVSGRESRYYTAPQAAAILGLTKSQFTHRMIRGDARRYACDEATGYRYARNSGYRYLKSDIDALAAGHAVHERKEEVAC